MTAGKGQVSQISVNQEKVALQQTISRLVLNIISWNIRITLLSSLLLYTELSSVVVCYVLSCLQLFAAY